MRCSSGSVGLIDCVCVLKYNFSEQLMITVYSHFEMHTLH